MPSVDRPEVVVCAALAHRPRKGGHAWALLQWMLGLRRLGYSTLLVDRLESSMVGPGSLDSIGEGLDWLDAVLGPFGLADDVAVLGDDGAVIAGVTRDELLARTRASVALLDVMGFCADDEVLAAAPRRVGLDIDPGFPQLWAEYGLADPFAHHDQVLTVGLNLGSADTLVPDGGRRWITTLPPVVLSHWPDQGPGPGPVTSVGAWRGPTGPLEMDGRRLGLRVHAARPLLDLPERSGVTLQMAWDLDPADDPDRAALLTHGWELVDPELVAGTPADYAGFVGGSSAELCIAKELYSVTRGGWFSDRSAVYLASGRPVVATDTGLPDHLLTGAGLVTCTDAASAVTALRDVAEHLPDHAAAARSLAEEHLDSDVVIGQVLEQLELT